MSRHGSMQQCPSEYVREDVNTLADLAGRRSPVAILSEATRGRPERSARYVEFLAPVGTPHEMRAAMVTRGRAWGCVSCTVRKPPAISSITTRASWGASPDPLRRPCVAPIASRRRGVPTRTMRRVCSCSTATTRSSSPRQPRRALLEQLVLDDPAHRKVSSAALALAADVRSKGLSGRSAPPLHVPTSSGWLQLLRVAARREQQRPGGHRGPARRRGVRATAGGVRSHPARERGGDPGLTGWRLRR